MNNNELISALAQWLTEKDKLASASLADALEEAGQGKAAKSLRREIKNVDEKRQLWTKRDSAKSVVEGYDLFSTYDGDGEVWMIQRDDNRNVFATDHDAFGHVVTRAKEGCSTALNAVFLHGRRTDYLCWEVVPQSLPLTSQQASDWLEDVGGSMVDHKGMRGSVLGTVCYRLYGHLIRWRFDAHGAVSRISVGETEFATIEEAAAFCFS